MTKITLHTKKQKETVLYQGKERNTYKGYIKITTVCEIDGLTHKTTQTIYSEVVRLTSDAALRDAVILKDGVQ